MILKVTVTGITIPVSNTALLKQNVNIVTQLLIEKYLKHIFNTLYINSQIQI